MTPSGKKLYASVDIGSNSSILLIAAMGDDGKLQSKLQKNEVCRLGDLQNGQISTARLEQLKVILRRFRQSIHNTGAKLEAVVMTEAVRRAENQDHILNIVKDSLWQDAQILSEEQEALLGWQAIAGSYGNECITLDVGGGSSEISNGDDFLSLPQGALNLTKRFGSLPSPELEAFFQEEWANIDWKAFQQKKLFLIGGTATALAMLIHNLQHFEEETLENSSFNLEQMDQAISRLSNLSDEIRSQLPGLEQGRGEIIICGLRLLRWLCQQLNPTEIHYSTQGLRFGVLYNALK
jgi:exopolyphosphatase/guanosine-5'-triphosphate,3'-diphosphate pyrophosphatase